MESLDYPATYWTMEETERIRHIPVPLSLSWKEQDTLQIDPIRDKRSVLRPQTKGFYVGKRYQDVENALQSRGKSEIGWVKAGKRDSQLIWVRCHEVPSHPPDGQIINHIQNMHILTSKSRLSLQLRMLPSVCGVSADSFYPRTYCMDSTTELNAFATDFRLTKVIAIQGKAVLAAFLKGEIELSSDLYSFLNFAMRYYDPEWSKDYQEPDLQTRDKATTAVLRTLLSRLSSRPQCQIDGSGDIWILKPGRKSRGRGISLHTSIASISELIRSNHTIIVQKYIETPLLVHRRKFDIRQWVLVSSVSPLVVWMYEECYIRFAVRDYDPQLLMSKFVHLTNNSVSKDAPEFAESKIEGCMWTLARFRRHLEGKFGSQVWTDRILPKIKAIIIHTILSAEKQLTPRDRSFELLGFDIMLSSDLSPWLLEVNSSPTMQHSTKVTQILVPMLLEDVIKIVVDANPASSRVGQFLRLLP